VTATLNGARVVSARIVTPWRGVWFAELDLDPDVAVVPTGKATLTIGTATLVGTVDPRASGRFVKTVRVRLVGGAGGWDKGVAPQHWHNDAGVKTATVYAATASAVGEVVKVAKPVSLGADFARTAGPASRVFGGDDWYVDAAGVTQVASRPAATPDVSVEILSFDASAKSLEVSADALVLPGTTFTDARFDGELVARDVEQTFDTAGSRATVWCGAAAVGRLDSAIEAMVREMSGEKYLRQYRYRFVNMTADRLNLQAVEKGAPDLQPVAVWPGMAGLAAQLQPSQTVIVAFLNGDPALPVIVGFDGNTPRSVSVDATERVHLAPSGSAPGPIARMGDSVSVFFPPVIPFTGTYLGAPIVGVMTIVNPAPGVITSGSGKADCGT
jgi:hypothetical protein